VLTNVVRIKPELTTHVLPYLPRMLKRVDHPTSKAALIFLLGGMELYIYNDDGGDDDDDE
jgi:hypothetical protein